MAPRPLTADERLWLAILEREASLQGLSIDDVRDELRLSKFPDHVIEAFLIRRAA